MPLGRRAETEGGWQQTTRKSGREQNGSRVRVFNSSVVQEEEAKSVGQGGNTHTARADRSAVRNRGAGRLCVVKAPCPPKFRD